MAEPQHEPPPSSSPRINWKLAAVLAFGPAVLSFVTLLLDNSNYGEKAMLTAIWGSIISGLAFGIHAGVVIADRNMATGILLGIVFGAAFAVITFALCFGGCALAGQIGR